jgi:hypothetical protein
MPSSSNQGFPYEWPLGWHDHKGQSVYFNFFLKATIGVDVLFKREGVTKIVMVDVIFAPHFEVKNIPVDVVFKKIKETQIPIDTVFLKQVEKQINVDVMFWGLYSPPDGLAEEQQKDSYVPYVEISEV